MGKEKSGFLTPKAISNRIKSKGLQRLRWYCQMCQKQCRDENGYKCHTMSEAHHRQMKVFMENGGKFISSFSSEFLKGYLDIVRRQFGGKRVHANVVYQEYIKDKEHIHMNATRWHSLTGLCLWLGKQGICKVDETEKGWFMEYIDRDPEKEKRQEDSDRLKKTEDEINRHFLQKQMEYNLANSSSANERSSYTPLVRENEEEPIKLNMSLKSEKKLETVKEEPMDGKIELPSSSSNTNILLCKNKEEKKINPLRAAELKAKSEKEKSKLLLNNTEKSIGFNSRPTVDSVSSFRTSSQYYTNSKPPLAATASILSSQSQDKKRGVLDELMAEEEAIKEKKNRRDFWLAEDLIVKLVNNKLPSELQLRRAVVTRVIDKYTAIVQVSDGTKIKVDQDHVETAIPSDGGRVRVINGGYRGEIAYLEHVDKAAGRCDFVIETGLCKGRRIKGVMLEDVCEFRERLE